MKPIASAALARVTLLAGVAIASLVSGALPAQAEIGVAAAVNIDAKGRPPGASPRVISLGSNIVFNEEITTDAAGLVQILLLDGTTFTVGPNSQLTIDEFVYNPSTGDAKVVATLSKGVFRFIGGRTSQTEGGATIKTPVGTIGIRGGIIDGDSVSTVLQTGEATVTNNSGDRTLLHKPGYGAFISPDGATTTVRKVDKAFLDLLQKKLTSGPGKTGGNPGDPPNDEETKEVSDTNSVHTPDVINGPLGEPRPLTIDELEQQAGIDGAVSDDIDDNIEADDEANARLLTAPAVYNTYWGGSFEDAGRRGLVGSNPDNDQLVRLEVEGDRLVSSDGLLDLPDYSGPEGDGPATYEYALGEFEICPYEGCDDPALLGTDALTGAGYAGRGDFVAYLLGIDDLEDEEDFPAHKPVYVIYGTPTPADQLEGMFYQGEGIREYRLTVDPIQGMPGNPFFGIPAPFFSNELYQGDFDSNEFHTTDFLVIEPGGSDTADTRGYLSWVNIQGTAEDQKSAIFLTTPNLYQNSDDNFQMDGGRRGSFRHGSGYTATNLRGGISTLPGATGGHFFGEDADHFVIGTSIDPADTFFDSNHDGALSQDGPGYLSDGEFATHHVGSLVNVTTQQEALSNGENNGLKNGGEDGKLTGFMAGMGETDHWDDNTQYRLTSNSQGTNLEVSFNAQDNAFAARGTVYDPVDPDDLDDPYDSVDLDGDDPQLANILLTFGHYSDGENEYPGAGTYIDDVHYGAVNNNGVVDGAPEDAPDQNTRIRTDSGADLPEYGFSAGSYIVSGRANPIDGYKHLESETYSCSDCDFIQWGWWGTRVQADVDPDPENDHVRTDYAHMGTWVAGEVSANAEIDNIAGQPGFEGNVSYDGTVMANVARDEASYIATGDLSVSYNFGSRSGTVDIDNFDVSAGRPAGVSLDGVIPVNSTPHSSLFSGTLTGANVYAGSGSLTGNLNGAFVNSSVTPPDGGPNVAAGLIGSFDFAGTGVMASGTMAGVRELPPIDP